MRTLVLALVLAAASCSTDPVPSDVPVASDAADVVATDTALPADVLDAGGAQACTAGRIEECPCGDGRRGMQTCQPSGVYGPCVCADAGSPMDVVVAADVVDAGAPRDVVDVVRDAVDVVGTQQYDVPSCFPDLMACGPSLSDCVRLSRGTNETPPRNCGACGVNCSTGQGCIDGRCVNPCPSGQLLCENTIPVTAGCVDLMRGLVRDGRVTHCGQCGGSCGSPLRCSEGRCVL